MTIYPFDQVFQQNLIAAHDPKARPFEYTLGAHRITVKEAEVFGIEFAQRHHFPTPSSIQLKPNGEIVLFWDKDGLKSIVGNHQDVFFTGYNYLTLDFIISLKPDHTCDVLYHYVDYDGIEFHPGDVMHVDPERFAISGDLYPSLF